MQYFLHFWEEGKTSFLLSMLILMFLHITFHLNSVIWTYTYHTPVFFVACNYRISQNHSQVSLCGITSGVVYYSNTALCRASALIDLILMMGYTFIFKKNIFRNSLLFIPQLENAVYCSVSLAYSVCIYNWNLKAKSLNNSIRKHIVFTVLSMNSNDHITVML